MLSDSDEEEVEKVEKDDIEEKVEKKTPGPTDNTSTENAVQDSISYPDSDSDSEPGLTIAEECDEKKMSSESETDNKKGNSPRKESKKAKSKLDLDAAVVDN